MNWLQAYAHGWYWRNGFSFTRAILALLSAFGALWLIIEIAAFFSPSAAPRIREVWWLFLIFGLTLALWINRPRHIVSCKLVGRDVQISVSVGDVFQSQGALVVGSNTSFDTAIDSIIEPSSVQGQFTARYYDEVSHLDGDIDASLAGVEFTHAVNGKRGKDKLYSVGAVAQVRPRGKTAYLLAIASINASGNASASFDDLKVALAALWEHISSRGTLDPIVVPVLGTGFSRLPHSREEIIREIIISFVAACSSKKFAPSLSIVVHGRDFYRNEVDLDELGRYLRHICRYTQFVDIQQTGAGRAL